MVSLFGTVTATESPWKGVRSAMVAVDPVPLIENRGTVCGKAGEASLIV